MSQDAFDEIFEDKVNHPNHYTQGGVECIEAIRASMPPMQFQGYCKGNAMKYLWRYHLKNGLEDLRKCTTLPLDCHLMIVHPEKYVERFAKAGADYITVHYEACKDNLREVLEFIRSTGAKCGAVINPDTPVSAIEKVIPLCDMVLVMSVFPGFGGQKFIRESLDKLREIRAIIDKLGKDIDLEIDGGVTLDNAKEIIEAGANVIVAGSAVFNASDRAKAISTIRGN